MKKKRKGREEGREGDLGESKVRLFCALSLLPVPGLLQVRSYLRREKKKHVTFKESSKQNSMLELRVCLVRQVKQRLLLYASVAFFLRRATSPFLTRHGLSVCR